MADGIPLPPSGVLPYSSDGWKKTEELLKTLINPSVDDVEAIILQHLNNSPVLPSRVPQRKGVGAFQITHTALPGLRTVLTGENGELYLKCAIPAAARFACLLPELLPSLSLSRLVSGQCSVVVLTRHQVASLLGHMFFCTTVPQGLGEYSVNFSFWHYCITSPTLAYLRCLMDYFIYIDKQPRDVLDSSTLAFSRRCVSEVPDWMNSTVPFDVEVIPETKSRIGDLTGPAEVDFANKEVGYGKSGTQEELLFGMSPEMCPVVLISDELLDTEALHIRGALRVGTYSGYGLDVQYLGVNPNLGSISEWSSRVVVAMDAIPYWKFGSEHKRMVKQLENKCRARELNKAFCAWTVDHQDQIEFSAVSTGHWGCGAFGGNKDIKAVIQLVAAAQARLKKMHYHTFDDDDFATKLMRAVTIWKDKKTPVGDIVKMMDKFRQQYTESSASLLDFAVSHM